MKKTSKCYLAFSVLAAALLGLSAVWADAEEQGSDARRASEGASVIALRTSAQWCTVCTSAKSAFSELKDKLSAEPVLFVTLDRADKASTRQAVYLANALGIPESLGDGLGKVGTVTIVDAQSKRLISTTPLSPNVDAMARTIKKALASGS